MPTTNDGPNWASETDLVAQLRGGDARAWETVVRRDGGALLGTARRIVRSEEDARCVVQSAFTKALTAIQGFRGGSLLSTWLHRIAVNEALMLLRSRARRPEASIEDLLPQFHDQGAHARPIEPWPEAERLLLQEETCARVRACVERLPSDYREVLVLRDIEELDTTEVAALLGITPNAVRIRVHRARMALRTLLEPFVAPRANSDARRVSPRRLPAAVRMGFTESRGAVTLPGA